ncbi:hypothetical protein HNQ27_23865 [Pseudomonas sp. B11D7D]|nr:hypothetical protein [Pseudomonas sp. B11D7D]QNH05669.1 hypothetical protein HNQ27_23865 [Pseudomonas sp. B11D7D]
MFDIKQDQAKDVIDWLKVQITISSAAVAALLFNAKGQDVTTSLKFSAAFFLVALIAFVASIAGLIEHRDSPTHRLRHITAIPILVGFSGFLAGFGAMVWDLF